MTRTTLSSSVRRVLARRSNRLAGALGKAPLALALAAGVLLSWIAPALAEPKVVFTVRPIDPANSVSPTNRWSPGSCPSAICRHTPPGQWPGV